MSELSREAFLKLIEGGTAKLDELIAAYPEDGKWDDALAVWAYGKGFQAGEHHAQVREDIICVRNP